MVMLEPDPRVAVFAVAIPSLDPKGLKAGLALRALEPVVEVAITYRFDDSGAQPRVVGATARLTFTNGTRLVLDLAHATVEQAGA